jgi:hypothetical protein
MLSCGRRAHCIVSCISQSWISPYSAHTGVLAVELPVKCTLLLQHSSAKQTCAHADDVANIDLIGTHTLFGKFVRLVLADRVPAGG